MWKRILDLRGSEIYYTVFPLILFWFNVRRGHLIYRTTHYRKIKRSRMQPLIVKFEYIFPQVSFIRWVSFLTLLSPCMPTFDSWNGQRLFQQIYFYFLWDEWSLPLDVHGSSQFLSIAHFNLKCKADLSPTSPSRKNAQTSGIEQGQTERFQRIFQLKCGCFVCNCLQIVIPLMWTAKVNTTCGHYLMWTLLRLTLG